MKFIKINMFNPPGQDNVSSTTIMANGSINGDKWRPWEIA